MMYNEYLVKLYNARNTENKMLWINQYKGYPADCPYSADNLLLMLNMLYETAHNNLAAVIKLSGGIAKVAKFLEMPYRTVQDWGSGKSRPSEGVTKLIGYALISAIAKE